MTLLNRNAWNTAALVGLAMVGKLPPFDRFFQTADPQQITPQSPKQMEVALRALAASWGAAEQEN